MFLQVLSFPLIKQQNTLLTWYFIHDQPLLQETCMGHSMTGWMHKAACGLSHPIALSDLGVSYMLTSFLPHFSLSLFPQDE